jgi:hypothetical protein
MAGVSAVELARLRRKQAVAYTQALLFRLAMSGRRFPDFDQVFPDPERAKRRMSGAEIEAVLQQWTVAINGGRASDPDPEE